MRRLSTALAALALATTVGAQPAGQGMMGQGGPGPGGYGYGPGMMGGWGGSAFADLDLSKEQRDKIAQIQGDVRRQHWAMMRSMQQQDWNLADAWHDGSFDEQAARKAFDAMTTQRKAMFDLMIDAQKRIDAVLTPAQREQLKRRSGGR
ncbi:MAG TPA: Spy/CpxP family protein refolding chaperone [Burkholderiaceae bacterium]|nr:Spy/CpxP family protein refolding chaperone [Burkholderiaceae bacterium]